jgi:hypothetical protein
MPSVANYSLEMLLSLNGMRFYLESGYWVKIEARVLTPTEQIPHGISYSLTLHDRNNTRVIGYDNAHSCTLPKSRKKFGGVKTTWDHRHHCMKVEPYHFNSPEQLLEDFWKDVRTIIS